MNFLANPRIADPMFVQHVQTRKFHGGSISKGSDLQIEVSEFSWRNVQLHGSLIVVAENILGSTRMDENGELKLRYWHRFGRCKLQNVKVLNEGIDWTSKNNTYWKHDSDGLRH
ncbi:hypothetical protein LOK49_LG11G00886 [Camellia lanceoleosa]|uniref:Uncharacterized protein n=1 Tax=Camellia lanceoleosa TaxID=1840588 RepID=A0ACC0G3J5_9ERIC|nr:hypothetical protein LOK49_LG11G00886 [Camellia lanceoleosa]